MMSIIGEDSKNCNDYESQNSSGYSPNLVRNVTYGLSSNNNCQQNCRSCGGGGLQATTIVCQKCARREIRINANPPPNDDPCFTRIPKNRGRCLQQDQGDSWEEGDDDDFMDELQETGMGGPTHRKKNYTLPHARRSCIPFDGHLTEYQDAYRKRNPKQGPRIYHRQILVEHRPAWNSSITVPPKPYQETLVSAEAKLKALDIFEDPPPDVMALAIIRDQIKERYRVNRSCGERPSGYYGVGGGAGNCVEVETVPVVIRSKVGGDRVGGGGGGSRVPSNNPSRTKPKALVKGSHLELVEEDSNMSVVWPRFE